MILIPLVLWGSSMNPVVGVGNHSLGLGATTKPEPVVPVSLGLLVCARVCGERFCAAASRGGGS